MEQEQFELPDQLRHFAYSKKDVCYRKAKEEGFRARSVYKLKEIEDNLNFLKNSTKILDLCAAPGSWSQMIRMMTKDKPDSKLVSVDLQDIVPIEGVTLLRGDITKQETVEQILKEFEGEMCDTVVCDGAPDVTGLIDIDMYMQVQLVVAALLICLKVLKQGGSLVIKVFRDKDFKDLYKEKFCLLFEDVSYFKPSSSRHTSHEQFGVCRGFKLENEKIKEFVEKSSLEELWSYEKQEDKEIVEFFDLLVMSSYNYYDK